MASNWKHLIRSPWSNGQVIDDHFFCTLFFGQSLLHLHFQLVRLEHSSTLFCHEFNSVGLQIALYEHPAGAEETTPESVVYH